MFKALILSLLLVLGSQAVNSGTIIPTETAQVISDSYTYEYQWIDGVRWVYVYLDGILIDCYPDAE